MKIKESKKSKAKYIVLIIINLAVIAAAGWLVYDRWFIEPKTEPSPQQAVDDLETIVFIGDYVTAFGAEQATLAELEKARPEAKFSLINLATESQTVESANLAIDDQLLEDLAQAAVDTIFISLGATDAAAKTAIETYTANIRQLVDKLSTLDAEIILNCPPYISDGHAATDGIILAYCQALPTITSEHTHFGDESAYSAFKNPDNILLSSDGIHPNTAGYQRLGELWAGVYQAVISD